MQQIICDICGRQCGEDAYETLISSSRSPLTRGGELHICKPRDGMDIGCVGHFKSGMEHARQEARVWLAERRPESVRT